METNLKRLLQGSDTDALHSYLQAMSNSDFRTASYMMGNGLLSTIAQNRYWLFFFALVPSAPKAFLGTFLKGLADRLAKGEKIDFSMPELRGYAKNVATDIDKQKIMEVLLPRLSSPEECRLLMELFGSGNGRDVLHNLLRAGTPASYYCMFTILRQYDDDPQLIRFYCGQLIKKGDALSFKVASLLHSYFGIEEVSGNFSLTLHPYELGRIEMSFDNFIKKIS